MSGSWEQSRAAQALRAAAALEAGAPPPLAAVREVAGRRAVRAARVMALLIAIPVGAAAAGGLYAWNHQAPPLPRRGEGRGEGAVRAQPKAQARKQAEPEVKAPVTPAPEIAPVVVAKPVKRAPPSASAPLTPTLSPAGESEVTPEIPAAGGYAPPPPPAAPQRTALADEAAVLTQALSALRSGHDPARAIELLSAYHTRFPAGALRHEAALASAEAHRALGHTADALIALEQAPRRPDLEVLRAELNAELGRCEDARDIVRGLSVTGALLERALFTDASCAVTLGARDEAIADLERLPASARARELLEKLK